MSFVFGWFGAWAFEGLLRDGWCLSGGEEREKGDEDAMVLLFSFTRGTGRWDGGLRASLMELRGDESWLWVTRVIVRALWLSTGRRGVRL